MAQTDKGKKKVYVREHENDGKKTSAHYRSTPSTSDGAKEKGNTKK